ncbi:unnamed protein product [Oikopleura dioica]|uniref:Uncharacterized protein n=1 Tax=Oikopleura dioica TaxID=34765 RepID=E4XLQ5_OIKDI|nr:unnamed protein product [Oikopleura dioica]
MFLFSKSSREFSKESKLKIKNIYILSVYSQN